jgi:putative transposase
MKLYPNQIFHVYNRGNNKQRIFFSDENYLFFLRKVRNYLLPHCDILAYCLMPNHFHFLIYANEQTCAPFLINEKETNMTLFSNGIKNLLSSYTKAINKQEKRTGSLFTQNTEAKMVSNEMATFDYSVYCMHYIHKNPVKSGLVQTYGDWRYSSFQDYAGMRNGTLCNKDLARKVLYLNWNNWLFETNKDLDEGFEERIF